MAEQATKVIIEDSINQSIYQTNKQTNNDIKRSTNIVDVLKTSKLFLAAYCRSEINLLFFYC